MKLLFATSNPNKVREVGQILAPLGIELETLNSLSQIPEEPDETGTTFDQNAQLKAQYYAAQTGHTCLAEDSGLEVDALGGAPGVHSARYAGSGGSRAQRDSANNAKLLNEIGKIPADRRQARFVCVMCVARPDGEVIARATGSYEGLITDRPAGSGGFGYDPLLYLPDRGCTSAELDAEEKNERSHRGAAARALAAQLKTRLMEHPDP